MKRLAVFLLVALLLSGCSGQNAELERVMAFRADLLGSGGCSFDAVITADYGDAVYTFGVSCKADGQGDLEFRVDSPETIAGITGTVSSGEGKLTFDDTALTFPLLADGQVAPVSAPWLLVKTLRSGYVTSCGTDGDKLRVSIDDSYAEDALHLEIWLGEGDIPEYAEILWKDRRIVSLEVKSFQIL